MYLRSGYNRLGECSVPEIEESSREITEALGGRAKILAGISKWSKITAAAGAAGVTLAKALTSQLVSLGADQKTADSIAAGITWVSATVVFISAILLLVADDNASKLLAKARIALDLALAQKAVSEKQAEEFEEFKNIFRVELDRLSHFQAARDLFRAVFQDVANQGAKDEIEVIRRMLDQARRQLFLAHGFDMSSYYTICVYKRIINAATGKAELHCKAHVRAIDCDVDKARIWKEGVGPGGVALARRGEVIISDLKAPNVSSVYGPQEKKAGDDERYGSIVAEPIIIDGPESDPWGVLIVSSSNANHFKDDDRTYVDVAASLAGMISLAICVVRAKQQSSQRVTV